MEAHYEAAHSHSPSPLLIFSFKKWGALNIFAHSCLLNPDGGGWWGAGLHPYQLLWPDVYGIATYNKSEYRLKTCLCKGMERFVVWSPEQHGNILSLENEKYRRCVLWVLGCPYRGQHQACQGQVWTVEVRWVPECWTLETWGSLASYPECWTSPSGRVERCWKKIKMEKKWTRMKRK